MTAHDDIAAREAARQRARADPIRVAAAKAERQRRWEVNRAKDQAQEARRQDILPPTPEQIARGGYERGGDGGRRGSRRVYTNKNTSRLRAAHSAGKITAHQLDAGEWFEEQWRTFNGSLSPRDCLDREVRGGSADPTTGFLNAEQACKHLSAALGTPAYSLLVDVCVGDRYIDMRPDRRLARMLLEGLDYVHGYKNRPKRS